MQPQHETAHDPIAFAAMTARKSLPCPITQRLELFFQALSLAEAKHPTRSAEDLRAAATAVLLSAA